MEMRIFGRTGLEVTRMGLGLAALGRPGYINLGHAADLEHTYSVEAMQEHAHRVLDAAWEAGIRYYDAARSYGRAEVFLSSWLQARRIPIDEVVVGSKWGYTYTANWQVSAPVHEIKEHSLPVLLRQRQESDANLDGYLDLYQIHSATLESGVLEDPAVLGQLAAYRKAGLAIGLTLSGPHQADTLRKAIQVRVDGAAPLFDAVQATWNLLEPSAGPALEAARQSGMGIIVKEALANGRLTAKNDDPAFASKRALLERAARDQNTTIDAVALAAVLAQPWADIVLSGAAAPDQVRSNAAAFQVEWSASLAEKLSSLAEPGETYWDQRSRLAWT